ncbi:50S ribosomal protein L28 [Patescibacteria group bacterium]|nr:50S ribosomal protein L28 [Patescibacteria group bacterium]
MSRVCDVCGRGPTVGIKKSHSQIKTKKRVFPNLQTKKIDGRKIKVCTNCLKNKSESV